MTFIWEHYLGVSKELQARVNATPGVIDDAYRRTAIGRAYYAAYNIALEHAELMGYTRFTGDKSGVNHGEIKNFYMRQPGQKRRICSALDRLHKRRKAADYNDPVMGNPVNELQLAIQDADAIVSLAV